MERGGWPAPWPLQICRSTLLLVQRLNLNIAVDGDLAGQAQVGVLLKSVAQTDLLQGGMLVDVAGGRDNHAIGGTEAITMTVRQVPQTAVDLNVVFQGRVTHMIALRHLYLYIFTDKTNLWHG